METVCPGPPRVGPLAAPLVVVRGPATPLLGGDAPVEPPLEGPFPPFPPLGGDDGLVVAGSIELGLKLTSADVVGGAVTVTGVFLVTVTVLVYGTLE